LKAKRIEGVVYRVKTYHGGFLVEVPDDGDTMGELARYCAKLAVEGCIISSVTRLYGTHTATPRVPVLTLKEYQDEIKRLTKEKKLCT